MADQYAISYADLRGIENQLRNVNSGIDAVESGVTQVNSNVKVVYDEIGTLARDFHDFVNRQEYANNKQQAQTELVRIRQELDKKYGHYDIVRRTASGIVQADDLGIVKEETITNATEELMITTPNYWLAPCLVALAAWINDDPVLAEKALKEAIRRNDEKTSLFFALICRRADRKQASLKWTQRYLASQDEENLDRKTIVVLDAYASGLLGADTEGVIAKQIDNWMDHLTEKPGFVEQQTAQWTEAIELKKQPIDSSDYPYLRKYSKTWPVLEQIMEGAQLHATILQYFKNIFNRQDSTNSLKEQLDDILNSLVSDFDDEELPLRREEKLNQFIVQYNGDLNRAQKSMNVEVSAFNTHKDFTQLLTDAAMKPESSHSSISTQKFAISLTKDWITTAYSDIVASNRGNVPEWIEINVDNYNSATKNGDNEEELIAGWNQEIEHEKADALSKNVLTSFDQFCLYGGIALAVVAVLAMVMGHQFLGLIALIAAIGMGFHYYSRKKAVDTNRTTIEKQYEEKREKGAQIIRATVAEVVDFRAGFSERDSENENVIDFLEQISPDQYVRKLSSSGRRIAVNK